MYVLMDAIDSTLLCINANLNSTEIRFGNPTWSHFPKESNDCIYMYRSTFGPLLLPTNPPHSFFVTLSLHWAFKPGICTRMNRDSTKPMSVWWKDDI